MEIGASSSCFYPLETETAFLNIAKSGIETAEIFFNSPSEIDRNFVKELKRIKDYYGTDVVSLHPYRSFSEGYDLFSKYKRRFRDAEESFKGYFEAAGELGAKYIILHGSRGEPEISTREYAERFSELNAIARSFGCFVAHENVVHYAGASPEFLKRLKELVGESFRMVLDIKQARRADVDYRDFIDSMGGSIAHVHLSDYSDFMDCTIPSSEGNFDFRELFELLMKKNYKGKYIVELYSDCFSHVDEIRNSALYLQSVLNKAKEGSK